MWAETNTTWLDTLSKIWPIVLSVVGGMSYIFGTRVRAKVNDAEQMAVTNAVERIEKIVEQLVEQKTRTQEHFVSLTDKVLAVCNDVKDIRNQSLRNSESIATLNGRLHPRKQAGD